MFPTQFEYHRPTSIQEAVQLLSDNPDAKLLAGGHSLLPAMKLRLAAPAALVDLARVPGLRGITANGNVTIGAMTTYVELLDSPELLERLPIMHETAHRVGDAQVRSRGTLGGCLAHADPAADYTAVMLALGASVKVIGSGGERTIASDDLFVDLLTTSLAPDEIITEITIPTGSSSRGMAYEKHSHPASGYAVVGVAAVIEAGEGSTAGSVRVAVTGATANAMRLTAVENALAGGALSAEALQAAADYAADGLELTGDHYASAEYRAHLLRVLTRRALERAASQISG